MKNAIRYALAALLLTLFACSSAPPTESTDTKSTSEALLYSAEINVGKTTCNTSAPFICHVDQLDALVNPYWDPYFTYYQLTGTVGMPKSTGHYDPPSNSDPGENTVLNFTNAEYLTLAGDTNGLDASHYLQFVAYWDPSLCTGGTANVCPLDHWTYTVNSF